LTRLSKISNKVRADLP